MPEMRPSGHACNEKTIDYTNSHELLCESCGRTWKREDGKPWVANPITPYMPGRARPPVSAQEKNAKQRAYWAAKNAQKGRRPGR